MNESETYLKLTLPKINQMQENQLLHLIQNPFPFSLEIIKYDDWEKQTGTLLLKRVPEAYSLTHILSELKTKHPPNLKIVLLHIYQVIIQQLLHLQSEWIEPDPNFLKPDILYASNAYQKYLLHFALNIESKAAIPAKNDTLGMLNWYVLPKGIQCKEQMPRADKSLSRFFIELNPQGEVLYTLLEMLMSEKKYKKALQICLTSSNKADKIEPKKVKPEKTKATPLKRKKSERGSKKAEKKNEIEKNYSTREPIKSCPLKSWLHQLKNKLNKNNIEQREITIPLNPQQELFRLAMLSEEAPGTWEENQGLRVFILTDEFLIGRDKGICDLCFSQKTIGRLHARITRHGNQYFIEDLGSKNGTFLDKKKLNKYQTYRLPEQCRLKFAEQNLYFIVD